MKETEDLENDLAKQIEQYVIEKQKEAQEFAQAVCAMSPEEIVDYLNAYCEQTDIVSESMSLVQTYTTGEAILVTALNSAKTGLDAAIMWMENHFSIDNQQAEEPSPKKKTESPKSQKDGKRIVYGSGEGSNQTDESEQL